MLWTKNPNFCYTPERRWASYTSEPCGESWDPLLNIRRSWGYPRVYLSYYIVVYNRMFWKLVHIQIKWQQIQFIFCKLEIINKNTMYDLLRFSRRLSRRLTFERGGRQSADVAFLLSHNPPKPYFIIKPSLH